MEQEILKDWQKKTIQFAINLPDFKNFYLTGGTALAVYYLRHRVSDDLDFFSGADIDPIFVHDAARNIKPIIKASEMRFSRLYDRWQFFYRINEEEIKIEFSKYPFTPLNPPNDFNGLAVDSEYDIAVNKLAAVLDRFDPKDFVDLYFLLPKFPLKELKAGLEIKFGQKTDALFLGGELSKARRVEALPKMLKPLTIKELKTFFEGEVQKLSSEVIEE